MNEKQRSALTVLKWVPLLSGIVFIILGILYYLWLKNILIGGCIALDGFFKISVGVGLSEFFGEDKEKDED